MNAIAGWFGHRDRNDPSILDAMERVLPAQAPGARGEVQRCGTLLVRGRATVRLGEVDGLRIALVGGPLHWSHRPGEAVTVANFAETYRRFGLATLERLRGPFALALVDEREDQALLAVDRMGIHPMSFSAGPDGLVFASTATAVAAHPACSRDLSQQALFEYLYFHAVPSPHSIYRDQSKLLPAQYLRYADGKSELGFYWKMPYREDNTQSYAELREEFLTLVSDSVATALDGRPAGAFLSGGTDSSTVCGMYSRHSAEPVRSYSIGFDAEGFDETEYARIAVNRFGLRPKEYYVTPDDVLSAIPLITAAYDEPFANESAIPAYYCAKLAAEDGRQLVLAGDGGDELFAGNKRYHTQLIFDWYHRLPVWLRRALVEPLTFGFPAGERIMPVRKARSYIRQATQAMPDRMENYNFLHRTPLADIFHADFLEAVNPEGPLENLREVYSRPQGVSTLNRMLHLDLKLTLADNDLRKVSRTAQLAGVEVRFPLLDERIAEFAAKVPPDLLLKGNKLRYFFKQSLSELLPREIIHKRKHGFGLPVGLWTESHSGLRELMGDSLSRARDRGIVKPAYIDWLLQQHGQTHATYYGVMMWVLMMLEQWLETHGR